MSEQTGELFGRKVGRFLGEKIGKPYIDRHVESVNKFGLTVKGEENLKELAGYPMIVAANHEIPNGKIDQQSGMAPDAFAIARAFADATGRELKIISKSDDGWKGWGPYGALQRRDYNFRRGFVEGMGLVPVRKNPGSFNRDFLFLSDESLKEGGSLLLFPQGNWYPDYNPQEQVYSGMAHLAKRNNAVIVPTYIHGAKDWNPGQKVTVAFGSAIHAENKEKNVINDEWVEAMTKLQKIIQSGDSEKTT